LNRTKVVARKRFELLSRAPEAPMLGHYTTGLQAASTELKHLHYNLSVPPNQRKQGDQRREAALELAFHVVYRGIGSSWQRNRRKVHAEPQIFIAGALTVDQNFRGIAL
jgi:hypothetical protein